MPDSILYIALVVATGSIFIALLMRKQLLDSKALVNEAAMRLNKTSQREKKLQSQVTKLQDDEKSLKDNIAKLETKLKESRKKVSSNDELLTKARQEMDEKISSFQRKTEIAEDQLQVMTKQLAEAVKEKKETQDENKKLSSNEASQEELKAAQAMAEKLKAHISELKKENKYFKGQVDKARNILTKVKPGELKRLQTKASKMEQLYTSMKGLRELAEERNQNWETALRLLSTHITGKKLDESSSVAPVLGEALEKIGAVLVVDEHTEINHSDSGNTSTIAMTDATQEITANP